MAAIIAQLVARRCHQLVAMTFGQFLVGLCWKPRTIVIKDARAQSTPLYTEYCRSRHGAGNDPELSRQ
jgi:hypothetical protein